jgi:hypothetical protein
MSQTAYELLALGLRYWFVLLIVLTLLRTGVLMRKDQCAYRRVLKQLPDAGLIGELVDLNEQVGQPLPREGLIGAGRSCDIRIRGLRRREMEFVFRPGLGVRLFPLHARHGALLDGEALQKGGAYALHGTVLELRGRPLRFRLFAGLDLPARVVYAPQEDGFVEDAFLLQQGDVAYPELLPPPAPPGVELENTWEFAPLPGEMIQPSVHGQRNDPPPEWPLENSDG